MWKTSLGTELKECMQVNSQSPSPINVSIQVDDGNVDDAGGLALVISMHVWKDQKTSENKCLTWTTNPSMHSKIGLGDSLYIYIYI